MIIMKTNTGISGTHITGPFIVIGNRGTSIPPNLRQLEPPLVVGINQQLPKTLSKPGQSEPLWLRSHAWISKRPLPFYLYALSQALKMGFVKRAKISWHDRKRRSYSGYGYFKAEWKPSQEQPSYVAVESNDWPHGSVERDLINDRRNEDKVGKITFEGFSDPEKLSVERLPSKTESNDVGVLAGPNEYFEGGIRKVIGNRYERNPKAREDCIKQHGIQCCVCGFDFETKYGDLGRGFVHIHHLQQLGDGRGCRKSDPVIDLRPVCPNCHAMLHRSKRLLKLEDLMEIVKRRKDIRRNN